MNLGIWDSGIQSSLFCSKSKIKFTKYSDGNVFMCFYVYGRNAIFSIMTYSKAPSIYSFLYPTTINWAPLSARDINEYKSLCPQGAYSLGQETHKNKHITMIPYDKYNSRAMHRVIFDMISKWPYYKKMQSPKCGPKVALVKIMFQQFHFWVSI